jgi:putative peptidoglycan lipid II flippase
LKKGTGTAAAAAAQTAILMAVLTLISKLIGFVREMVMANYFGTSFITDAYVMSFTILSVLFGSVIAAVSTAYMPVYSRIRESEGPRAGDGFTSRVLNLLLVITVGISVFGIIFSDQLIAILAGGFSGETARLASFFVKVLFAHVIFSSIAGILESYLQYKNVFLPQIVSGYCISACTIAAIVISARTSHYYLAFGVLTGYFVRLVLIAAIAGKQRFRYTPVLNFDANIRNTLIMAIPTFIGGYAVVINQFVDKTLASGLPEGSISALNYAALLNALITGLTVTILSTIIYPKMTRAVALREYDRLNAILDSGLSAVLVVALPFSLGVLAYSGQVVQLVYERGAFDVAATVMTGSAFFYYAGAMLFSSMSELVIKTYYAMSDMKTPMIFSGVSVIINIALSLILIRPMAHSGLALATSVAAFFYLLLLWTGIRRKYPQVRLVESTGKIVKIAVSAAAAVGGSRLVYTFVILPLSHIIVMRAAQLGLAVLAAALIYAVLLKRFKIPELELLWRAIWKRGL